MISNVGEASLHQVVERIRPDECYHLAAQSFVSYSFDDEFSTLQANINGTHYLLAALKNLAPGCRFCNHQARAPNHFRCLGGLEAVALGARGAPGEAVHGADRPEREDAGFLRHAGPRAERAAPARL